MTNTEFLISSMDKFIIDYGMLPYGGIPFVYTIMGNVLPQIPNDMLFTEADIQEVANFFNTKYPGHYTVDVWYSEIADSLKDHLGTTPPAPAPPSEQLSKPLLIFGGVLLLIMLLGKRE